MALSLPLSKHFRINEYQTKALKKLGVVTLRDLLYHFPARYITSSNEGVIQTTTTGDMVSVVGVISKTKARKAWKSKIPMTEAMLKDESGSLKLLWLHQPYISKMFPEGSLVVVAGKIKEKDGKRTMINPEITHADTTKALSGSPLFDTQMESGPDLPLLPVYPESRGVTSRWFFYAIQKILTKELLKTLSDPIPKEILKKYNLPALGTALVWMHTPKSETDAVAARKRFAFEEVFFIQLQKQQERAASDALPTWDIAVSKKELSAFIKRFPFTPTNAQTRAIESILENFASPHAMSRLLEGDVGSGKTFVAAATAHCVVTSHPKDALGKEQDFGNLQVAYMAPTEILAQQHFESFIEFFRDLPIHIGLITSSGCKKFPSKVNPDGWTDISRTQLLKWVANGEIPILIGTHALIQKTVKFKHLAYVIIDEQHRFGTNQRAGLAKKTDTPDRDVWRMPHLLSMTATPIPRTLALTVYGDLDLTLLDEQPKGRKEIKTEIVTPAKRAETYAHIQTLIDEGRQVFVVCPRIDEPDPAKETALRAKSVVEEARRLKKEVFPKARIGIVHGKMKPQEKEDVMKAFADREIDILVATSVIEVGVNVPNATAIIIEGADRFGLAQLHQLRGRVLRSSHQAYCYLFTEARGAGTIDRLRALAASANGFELAEKDLELRGSGELYGGRQWGITDVGMEALKNLKMVEAARNEARTLIETDPELTNTPLLADAVRERESVHFE